MAGIRCVLYVIVTLTVNLWTPCEGTPNDRKPNIILVVADDLGWNDVSWHNPRINTPNMEKLAYKGVTLEQSYTLPRCTPSRVAFLTGYYPYHVGLQHSVIIGAQPNFIPEKFTLLPKRLRDQGYATHMVGKWHLGFCNWKHTPTYRGFDSFVGYYQGREDFYTHVVQNGYDFRFNEEVYKEAEGEYSTEVFERRSLEIITNHNDSSQPLFLYLAFQTPHSPLQVPQKYYDMYPNIKNENRRIYAGMVTSMDDAIGKIVEALAQQNMLDNSVIIFTTDNGGQVNVGGNNYPLRGQKSTLWEGGTRGPAFVYSPNLIKHPGRISDELMHIVDWFPTILHLAGGKMDSRLDGVNQWQMISKDKPSARKEFVYNIDNINNNGAIRVGNFKLMKGFPGNGSGWYPAPESHSRAFEQYIESFKNNSGTIYRLFDLGNDPNEYIDLAGRRGDILEMMIARLKDFEKSETPAIFPPQDPKGNPQYFNGVWSPGWC